MRVANQRNIIIAKKIVSCWRRKDGGGLGVGNGFIKSFIEV